MKQAKQFPPGAGWMPVLIMVVLVGAASAVALIPQFNSKVIVGSSAPGQAVAGAANPSAGATAGAGVIQGQQGNNAGGTTTKGGAGGATGKPCQNFSNGNADGVSANEIHVASTIVSKGSSSPGADFLGEAQDGILAAIAEVNNQGGICGHRITFESNNTDWNSTQGAADISSWINGHKVFALVAEPDSEGLRGAIDSQMINQAQIPVVGTDGMLSDQYKSNWVWPVAASTVTNMHIIAKHIVDKFGKAAKVGIVYDQSYKFGSEGARAFDAEMTRLTGNHIPGSDKQSGCNSQYCGIDSNQTGGYSTPISTVDQACSSPVCDAVVMLLEPSPMEAWMKGEQNQSAWFNELYGGEPLFDDNVANHCPGCGQAPMKVWTGYFAATAPFDTNPAVARYISSLHAQNPNDDAHNEFTEGAYLGTRLFIEACKLIGQSGAALTRATLQATLNSHAFDLGLTNSPVTFGGGGLPHIATSSMAEFQENYLGNSFNGWTYLNTGFIADPAKGQDLP